ncbi:hypothetical protein PO124_33415 [Bacillus licheniformis]|nr:hypothetical protein [Bacillus licheniformis]
MNIKTASRFTKEGHDGKKAIWLLAGMFVFSTLTAAAAFPDKEKSKGLTGY